MPFDWGRPLRSKGILLENVRCLFLASAVLFLACADGCAAAPLTPAAAGLAADELTLSDGAVDGNRLKSQSHCFIAADVKKAVVLFEVGAPGSHGRASFPTFIAAASSCTAILAMAPAANGTGLRVDFGTDDWNAFNAMAQKPVAVDFGKARIMLATPGDIFNTVRTVTVRNTSWTGSGAYIALGESGAASDSGNQIAFMAQNFHLDGTITFDGQYASYGKDQYNMKALASASIRGMTIGPGITVTGTKGACYFSTDNMDERVAGLFEHCGDFWHLVAAPADPQSGRPFGVWQQNVHGHLDDRGLRARFAAQSGLFIQSGDPKATVTMAGSRIENSGFFNYDLETWAGTENIDQITSIQDPAAKRDYSHPYGGVNISNTSRVTFDLVDIAGSNGNDFVLNPQNGDKYRMESLIGGTIHAVSGPNSNDASKVYLAQIGDHTQKVAIEKIVADVLTVYPSGASGKDGAAAGSNGIWIGEFSSPGKYSAGPNLVFTNYSGGSNLVSIRSGQAATIAMNSAAGPVLLDLGPDFHFKTVRHTGNKGAYLGDVERDGGCQASKPEACRLSLARWRAAAHQVPN
ncbi:MAG: hypothetical protein JWP16_1982 [Alphaproteobacteria bacterium]|nr:hypothetical protein [Alphaproteobacteria bacterium]MDB5740942.1 hypothetical protein [Alphaproteobacteria bacterium]